MGLRQMAFLLIPASVIVAVLATPIIRLLYQRGAFTPEQTTVVAGALAAFSLGLSFNGAMLMLNAPSSASRRTGSRPSSRWGTSGSTRSSTGRSTASASGGSRSPPPSSTSPAPWSCSGSCATGAQTPQRKIDSLDALMRTPIAPVGKFASGSADGGAGTGAQASVGASPSQSSLAYGNPGANPEAAQRLANLATTTRGVAPQIVNHYNVQPVFDVYANVDRQDLGTVGTEVRRIMDETEKKIPKSTTLDLRGQVATMETSFYRLGLGLIFAIVLVYFLMALNFQSWLDPFIILTALPGALAGILWMLFVTQTTFSVPSLMGAIMCIGVATANSILVVVFANDQRLEGMDERAAALAAGSTRIRPVLMTAAAMIIGMLPMALGLGEGGEQNSPLGRAVIGGLLLATVTTLFIVPIVYSLLRKKAPVDFDLKLEEEEREDVSAYLTT